VARLNPEAWPITAAAPQRLHTVFPIVHPTESVGQNLPSNELKVYPSAAHLSNTIPATGQDPDTAVVPQGEARSETPRQTGFFRFG
jgi:hypothetical protein